MGSEERSGSEGRLTVLGIYPWDRFWSMGEFKGAASFFLAPQSLTRSGHRVHISMPARRGALKSSGPEDYHGMQLHRFGPACDFTGIETSRLVRHLLQPFRYLLYLVLATLNGLHLARQCRPDAVVGYGAFAAPVAYIVARTRGVANVTRLFGQSVGLGLQPGFRAKLRLLLNFPEVIAFLTPCSRFIVVNEGSAAAEVARRLGVAQQALRHWRNGVDKGFFSPGGDRRDAKEALGLDPEAPLLLAVSRLDREKGHGLLLRAMPEVLEAFPASKAVIVGEGPDRAYLEGEIVRLGLSRAVRLPGVLPREEVVRYYRACDVFLSLSPRANVGNTTLEAMSCGCCVVALAAGDTADTVAEDRGVPLDPAQAGRLGAALVDLLRDEARRARLGQAARRFVEAEVPTPEGRGRMEAAAVAEAAQGRQGPRNRG